MKLLSSVPVADGFYLPAEGDWHEGSWIMWPQRTDNWRNGAKPVQKVICEIADQISRFEPVTVCASAEQYENARNQLSPQVRVIEMSSNEAFIRDTGPTFVTNGAQLRGINWTFNGYGGLLEGLYFPWDLDGMVAQKMCETIGCDYYKLQEFVMEGCALCTDGDGTLVVTEECLLCEGRNPNLSKEQMEQTLKNYLGVKKVIWLTRGLIADEGKGHIDNLFCFVKPGEALLSWTDDPGHPQYEVVHETLEIISRVTDAKNRPIVIHKMPLPSPIVITPEESDGVDRKKDTLPRMAGDVLVASYLNFYMPNGSLIYPTFGDENDAAAREIFRQCFPKRTLVGVYAREIFLGGGGIHSMVLHQPNIW